MIDEFRALAAAWEAQGHLRRVDRPVSPVHEVAAIAAAYKGARPLRFEHVAGIAHPVVIGMGGDRTLLAKSLDAAPCELVPRLMEAIVRPLPTRTVPAAPVYDTVVRPPLAIGEVLPALTYHELDAGPYHVLGVLVVRSADGGRRYLSVRRMQVLAGNRMSVVITSPELRGQVSDFENARRPVDVAVMFGVVPGIVLCSQVPTHLFHVDKLDVAGALLGAPLAVARCQTVDLEVLAGCEWVIEGRILPGVREPEGPFGELGGYYSVRAPQPVIEITAVAHRSDPIIQTVLPGSYEERLPGAVNRELVILQTVRQSVPGVRAVHVTMGGLGRFHAIVQIAKQQPGDGKQAALAAFAADKDVKHVVVVDDDVDLFDLEDVEWAIATRVQANEDVFVVAGARGSPLESSHLLRGVTAKVGIDATYPQAQAQLFRRIRIPGKNLIDLADYGLA